MPIQVANNALILIGILPSARDLDIARMLGWYRIPLKSSPKVIDVDYFAFYQGASFGEEHRWRIEYLAEYRGHELTTRRELLREERDHPRANEEYYKVQIGPLIAIDAPILADAPHRTRTCGPLPAPTRYRREGRDSRLGTALEEGTWRGSPSSGR